MHGIEDGQIDEICRDIDKNLPEVLLRVVDERQAQEDHDILISGLIATMLKKRELDGGFVEAAYDVGAAIKDAYEYVERARETVEREILSFYSECGVGGAEAQIVLGLTTSTIANAIGTVEEIHR